MSRPYLELTPVPPNAPQKRRRPVRRPPPPRSQREADPASNVIQFPIGRAGVRGRVWLGITISLIVLAVLLVCLGIAALMGQVV